MRIYWAAAAAFLLLGGIAQADEQTGAGNGEPAIGVGIICNTSEQAERYISLINGGAESVPAMNAINREAHNPQACGIATVAFTRDATLELKSMRGKLMQIVRITVMAGFDGFAWQRVSGRVQFAVFESKGQEI